MQSIHSTTVGQRLEQAARTLAPVLVAVYCAGLALGSWVHATSDRLARLWVAALGLEHPAPAEPQPQLQQEPQQRPSLAGLKVPELRTLARHQLGSGARVGGRRIAQARRADLLLALS